MIAMIYAAGRGTRLRPLTDRLPKALVEVAGKPMMEHVACRLKAAGCDRLVVNVHHFAAQVADFLRLRDGFGLEVSLSDETACLLDTGGGLAHAAPLLAAFRREGDDAFLVHNVDILSDCDLQALLRSHVPGDAATLLVSDRPSPRRLLFDDEGLLRGWVNTVTGQTKPAGFTYEAGRFHEYAYSGIQAVDACLPGMMPTGTYSIIDYYLSVCHHMPVRCRVEPSLRLLDIGKPETLLRADSFLASLS